MKLDAFHCALLVAIVLLAVYAFGSFREGNTERQRGKITHAECVSKCTLSPTHGEPVSASQLHTTCEENCNEHV